MVVREPLTGTEQTPMNSARWTSSVGQHDEDSSDSSSSQRSNSARHKRKVGDIDNGEDDEKELKRRKNREAAKRCRDKKQQQTEELKQRNEELEKENCMLASQRDELISKCKVYQRELEQHERQGCVVPHFNPPYDLEQILNPASPTSPSFNESTPSISSSPSPVPSISPGPSPSRMQTHHVDHRNSANGPDMTPSRIGGNGITNVKQVSKAITSSGMGIPTTVTTLAPAQKANISSQANKVYYLRVRNKDGTEKTLCLDRENYIKVTQRFKAQLKSREQQAPNQSMQPVVSSDNHPQKVTLVQSIPDPQLTMKKMSYLPESQMTQNQSETEDDGPQPGQKLDTFDDLISVLKGNVKNTGKGFEFVPINTQDNPVKEELIDREYEQQSSASVNTAFGMVKSKQEVLFTGSNDNNIPDSSGHCASTGQQIRAGLDILTNQDETVSSNTKIQSIVQFLKKEENPPPLTVTSHVDQMTTEQYARPPAVQMAPVTSTDQGQRVTYITSSAPFGSLNKINENNGDVLGQQNQKIKQSSPSHTILKIQNERDATSGEQHGATPMSSMPSVKLRPHINHLYASPVISDRKLQMTNHIATSSAQPSQALGQTVSNIPVQGNGSLNASEQQIINTSMDSGSVQAAQSMTYYIPVTNNGTTIVELSEQRQSDAPPLQIPQQDSTVIMQQPVPILAPVQQPAPTTDNQMSESMSQIVEYLKTNGLEALNS